jgi:hypothetical protein
MASSIRDLQILAQQHFAVRDPVIATDGAALIYIIVRQQSFLSPPYGPFTIYNLQFQFKEEPEKTKCAPCLAQSVPHMTVPTCVVEEPEDWMGEYPDTPSQPFQLREFRTGQLVGVMAGSIRDLQILAQQHFAVRDPPQHMSGLSEPRGLE